MKIVLPKTLAEPLTIPWFQMKSDSTVQGIMAEIQRFLDFLKDKGWTNSYSDGTEGAEQDLSLESRNTLMRSLRILTRNAGGLDVQTGSWRNHDKDGYTFWIFFNTHEGGPRHSKDFSIVRTN